MNDQQCRCLKCGEKLDDDFKFCDDCLRSMDKYPVKPGTVIQLHRREVVKPQKKATKTKRHTDAEEQIIFLKKALRAMSVLLVIAVIALGLSIGLLLML